MFCGSLVEVWVENWAFSGGVLQGTMLGLVLFQYNLEPEGLYETMFNRRDAF